MRINKKKTEEQIVIDYLLKQGGRELTEEEKKSPMYKESIESARRLTAKDKKL